ncbi:MAG: hypothetical protein ABIP53_05935 [Candidatus Limnocylindrales bacterium]
MATNRRFDETVSEWLEETAPGRLPERVLSSTFERTRQTRQNVGWHAVVRRFHVNRLISVGIGVAAVVVVAVIGARFLLPQPSGVGGPPSTQPSATPAPTAAPSPTANASPLTNLPSWYTPSERPTGLGILPAGSHTTQRFSPSFTFSVPVGWVNPSESGSYIELFPDTPANQAEFARSESLAHVLDMGVHPTPWFTCESLEDNRGATADEMVAAASANEALAVSEPVDVSIGGLTGKQFDVRRNPDWTGTCPGDADLPQGVDPEDERSRATFLDVPGRGVLVILLYSMSSAQHEAFLAEAMPILESFQFSQ